MSVVEYFEQHEEQAFVAKCLVTAVAIILVKHYLSGLIAFLFLIFPVVFLIGIRMHAAASGVDAMELLREHVTFLPVMRSEGERRTEVKPWVTYGLICANVLIFYLFEGNVDQQFISDNLVFLPHRPDPFNVVISAFTALFLHGGNGHLWGNMTFLWVVGTAVERRVGKLTFFWLYLATGLIGGLVFVAVEYLAHGQAGHALGASGAIAGIMGVFAVRCYFKTMIFPVPILGIFSLIFPLSLKIRLNSLVIMALFFLSDLSGGIDQITGEGASMIGHWAHLGGMISGMLMAGYLRLGEDAVEERHLELGIRASEATVGFEGGERSMQIVLERNPDNVDALLGLARLKSRFTALPEGRELYEKAIRLVVRDRPGELLEVFCEYFAKYRSLPPDPALAWRLIESLRKAGEVEMAINCLKELLEMGEASRQVRERALFQLATLLEFTSCFEAARGYFARFVAEFPGSILAEKAREKAGDALRSNLSEQPKGEPEKRCPNCGEAMVSRQATAGAAKGRLFLVCGSYPACRTALPVPEPGEDVEYRQPVVASLPESYRLVFDGTFSFSADPEESRENLARLLRCGRDRVESMIRSGKVVLKKGLDQKEALRLKEAFDRTGAICTMEPEEPRATVAASRPSHPSSSVAAATVRREPAVPAAAPASVPTSDFECPKCGELQEKGESCARCGVYFAKLSRRAEREFDSFQDRLTDLAQERMMSEQSERRWAMCCHLMALTGLLLPFFNVLGPLAIWLWKRKESQFIDIHGKTALNFQLTLFLLLVGTGVVAVIARGSTLFVVPFLCFVFVYMLAMIAVGAIKSHRGQYLDIPLSAEIIKYA